MLKDAKNPYRLLEQLRNEVVSCSRCPRLVTFRQRISKEKRSQFKDWEYWGKPVPGFGNADSRLILVGLAPAAHGGNRTGRVFTGDKSGDFLVRCLYDVGLANQPDSNSVEDGLELKSIYLTPVLKCAPPGDKPTSEELRNCFQFFSSEIELLSSARCVIAFGRLAFDGCIRWWKTKIEMKSKDFPFGHGKFYDLPGKITLVASYHPSPRNVNTGRLTYPMMLRLLEKVKLLVPNI
ncbi:MAG: uracil-DNA glycosylase [Candidatus Neomarinimicrobiota bacterium]